MSLDKSNDDIKNLIDSKYPINTRTGSVQRVEQIKRVRKWYYKAAVNYVNGNRVEYKIIEEWLNESC